MSCNYSENLRNFAWQFHLKNISEANLTKQNLPVFHSCAVNSLHFNKRLQTKKICSRSNETFDLWWNPSVSHFSWEKKEILQFFILAGQKKMFLSWVDPSKFPLPFAPTFLFHGPMKDGLFTQTHLRMTPILLESMVFFHGYIFAPLKLMLPNSCAHELLAVQIMTIFFSG